MGNHRHFLQQYEHSWSIFTPLVPRRQEIIFKKINVNKSVNDTDKVLPMKMISIHEQGEKNVIHGTTLLRK